MQQPPFRLPRDDEHALVVGKNGTGKTHGVTWQFSLRSYDVRPWLIVDIKREKFFAELEELGAREIPLSGSVPREPGVYIVRPRINETRELDDHLKRVWEREGTGVILDEGYAVGTNNVGARLLWMQGRSKLCPVITLSQRPLYLDRYAVSEASHYQVFRLNDARDWEVIQRFTPGIGRSDQHYGKARHNSMWYNSNDEGVYRLGPAPDRDTILATFERRMPRKRERWV